MVFGFMGFSRIAQWQEYLEENAVLLMEDRRQKKRQEGAENRILPRT